MWADDRLREGRYGLRLQRRTQSPWLLSAAAPTASLAAASLATATGATSSSFYTAAVSVRLALPSQFLIHS